MYNQLRWRQHVAQVGETRNAYGQWVEEPEGRQYFKPKHIFEIVSDKEAAMNWV